MRIRILVVLAALVVLGGGSALAQNGENSTPNTSVATVKVRCPSELVVVPASRLAGCALLKGAATPFAIPQATDAANP